MVRKMTIEDIDELIPLHKEAFGNSINILAGRIYLYHMFKWFINSERIAIVGLDEEMKITGYVFGAKIGYDKGFNRYIWIYALIGLLRNPFSFFNFNLLLNIKKRIFSMLNLSKASSNKKNELYESIGISLVGIAVHPKSQGSEFSSELINAFEDYAKNEGANYLRLSVHKENKRAQNFYLKHSWVEDADNSSGYFYKKIDCP